MFKPSKRISPDVGTTIPNMVLISVVLPQPFGPIKAIHCPSLKSVDTESRAFNFPNCLLIV